jgi:dihydroorotate dehydrogenase (NAD+) catalytic subunit
VDAGADGISVINTIPGLLIDLETRRPALGFGTGGVSGASILPVGVLATARVARAVNVPIIGVGGIATAEDALQYLVAGASLVALGTAAMRDPRAAERVVQGMEEWCDRHHLPSVGDIVGTLEWQQ